ncbi:hypothetical protein CFC21_089566 [Triticum aestivum]|uniref:Peptidase A1 domain-containing protein n=2 Tax=Triticum aestivum TaxID=4565 RepID=A0A9R1ILH0_WHEAT|nr:hypothetical protein CFC21_089566 [Triticum aestivum]
MRISSTFLLLLCASTTLATGTGVRIQLKHVDADANITTAERLRRAGVRLQRRLELLSGVAVPFTSRGVGDYIAEFSIGDPPQAVQGVIDTSSVLVWTQCMTCRPNCFAQNLEYYDFSLSSTGRAVPCNSSLCADDNAYEKQRCAGGHGGTCTVRASYGEAGIAGVLRRERFTFGTTTANIAFGCITETNNSVQMALDGASGLIGLGYGDLSLVTQLGATRFSYCLTRFFGGKVSSSTLFIGPSAGLSGDTPVTSIPYQNLGVPFSSFYYLLVSGMSVGRAWLNIPFPALGVIVDSNFPFMSLVDVAYKELIQEVSRQLGGRLVASPVDWLELCVAAADVRRLAPPMVLHFQDGGEDLTIPAENMWAPMDRESTSCMMVINSATLEPPMNRTTIIGSYMQQDMHVLYDLDNHQISFQKADCNTI